MKTTTKIIWAVLHRPNPDLTNSFLPHHAKTPPIVLSPSQPGRNRGEVENQRKTTRSKGWWGMREPTSTYLDLDLLDLHLPAHR
jgi:hypothetical protein